MLAAMQTDYAGGCAGLELHLILCGCWLGRDL